MRFLRFTLLQSYILSIQKNKRKALLIINTGIFLSIFAFSSATISFFIEKKISDIQNALMVTQIETRYANNMISYVENEINILEKSLFKEENSKSEKRFLDEFKNFKRVTSQKDVYGPFIYYTLYEFQKEIAFVKEFLDKDSSFNTDIVIPYVESRFDEENTKSFKDRLETISDYTEIILKMDLEQFYYKKPLTLEEIIFQTTDFKIYDLNISSQIFDDYKFVVEYLDKFNVYLSSCLDILKDMKFLNDEYITEYKNDILYYSNLEKNIILVTFIFQFAIFLIIQIFEINSINFNLKKRIK